MEGFYWEACGILGGHTCGDTLLFLKVYILLFHGVLACTKP
jgi:hypothetical protein